MEASPLEVDEALTEMSKRYTTLPSISAEIFPFVELCVLNNPSSSDESIVFLNPGSH